MRAALLPSLDGFITNGPQLRRELAKAISSVETYSNRNNGVPASAAKLTAFLTAGNTAVTAVLDRVASIAITGTQTVTVAAPTSQLTVTATKRSGGTTNVTAAAAGTTYVSSDPTKATVSGAGLVTRVANGTTTITATNVTAGVTKTATRVITVTS